MSAHITDIGGLAIRWDHRILEPRPWTVEQAEWLAELASDAPQGAVLELCSGAGHLGLVVGRATGRPLVLVDINPAAAEFAAVNAEAAGLEVEMRTEPMSAALRPDERFPLILADPPWVPRAEVGRFPDDPPVAIDGGPRGLDLAVQCLAIIDAHLVAGGAAVLQLGTEQQVDELLAAHPPARVRPVECRTRVGGVLVHLAA